MKRSDEVGKKYGKLLVREFAGKQGESIMWLCICDCGNLKIVRGGHLRSGSQVSCGCRRDSANKVRFKTHEMTHHPFYDIYRSMLSRCNNPKNKSFKDYGAKGVKCLWQSFNDFKDDMYDGYVSHIARHGKNDTSLDRIDPFGHYNKENCRWATWDIQNNNRRSHRQLRM